jgi:hypothetical protein
MRSRSIVFLSEAATMQAMTAGMRSAVTKGMYAVIPTAKCTATHVRKAVMISAPNMSPINAGIMKSHHTFAMPVITAGTVRTTDTFMILR